MPASTLTQWPNGHKRKREQGAEPPGVRKCRSLWVGPFSVGCQGEPPSLLCGGKGQRAGWGLPRFSRHPTALTALAALLLPSPTCSLPFLLFPSSSLLSPAFLLPLSLPFPFLLSPSPSFLPTFSFASLPHCCFPSSFFISPVLSPSLLCPFLLTLKTVNSQQDDDKPAGNRSVSTQPFSLQTRPSQEGLGRALPVH